MQAAGIVRIGGGDDAGDAAFAIVADDHLAMVGLEIEQPRPGAEAHLVGPGVERIRQAGLARSRRPTTSFMVRRQKAE